MGLGVLLFVLLSGLAVKLVPDAWRQMMCDVIAERVTVSVQSWVQPVFSYSISPCTVCRITNLKKKDKVK